jgi:hypothetical protein
MGKIHGLADVLGLMPLSPIAPALLGRLLREQPGEHVREVVREAGQGKDAAIASAVGAGYCLGQQHQGCPGRGVGVLHGSELVWGQVHGCDSLTGCMSVSSKVAGRGWPGGGNSINITCGGAAVEAVFPLTLPALARARV